MYFHNGIVLFLFSYLAKTKVILAQAKKFNIKERKNQLSIIKFKYFILQLKCVFLFLFHSIPLDLKDILQTLNTFFGTVLQTQIF